MKPLTTRIAGRVAGLILGISGVLCAFAPAWAESGDNILKIANSAEISTLDPHMTVDMTQGVAKTNLYDTLYRWSGNPPQLVSWLAKSHTVSQDGRVYTIDLVEGAKFHDGSDVTAQDVVYSLERVLALQQGPARFFLPLIESGRAEALDDHRVRFTLTQPASPFLGVLASLPIVNSDVVKQHEKDGDWGREWLSKNEAGGGPFQLTHFDPASGWSAERFDGHFDGWPENALDGIQYRTIREPNSQAISLMRGDTDLYVGTLSVDQIDRISKSPNIKLVEEQGQRLFLFHMNNQVPPFTDVHVRRAFSYAFDYEGFIQGIVQGKATRNPAPLPRNLWGYPEDIKGFTYDLDKAREELAKASVKIDGPIAIHIMTGNARTEEAAQVLQAGLRQIGIEARLVPETWPTLAAKCRSIETAPQLVTMWASAHYADPHGFLGDGYDSTRPRSYQTCNFYKNKKVDALLARAYVEINQDVRRGLYEEIARIIVEDAPSIYIYNEKWIGAMNKRVMGVEYTPIGWANFLKPVWIEQ